MVPVQFSAEALLVRMHSASFAILKSHWNSSDALWLRKPQLAALEMYCIGRIIAQLYKTCLGPTRSVVQEVQVVMCIVTKIKSVISVYLIHFSEFKVKRNLLI